MSDQLRQFVEHLFFYSCFSFFCFAVVAAVSYLFYTVVFLIGIN